MSAYKYCWIQYTSMLLNKNWQSWVAVKEREYLQTQMQYPRLFQTLLDYFLMFLSMTRNSRGFHGHWQTQTPQWDSNSVSPMLLQLHYSTLDIWQMHALLHLHCEWLQKLVVPLGAMPVSLSKSGNLLCGIPSIAGIQTKTPTALSKKLFSFICKHCI